MSSSPIAHRPWSRVLALFGLAAVLLLSGCAANPVTGEQELVLVSESEELQIGRENYGPMQQAEGGEYVIDKELTAYVNQIGQRLAAVSDRKLPYEFVVLNNSVPNAWALPGGKIAINRGLLTELNSEAELAAVLGHEIVHAAARHSAKKIEQGMFLNIGLMAVGVAASDSDYAPIVMLGSQVGAALLSQKYSRSAESEADYYGMIYMSRAGYDPRAAIKLQETFVRLSEGQKTSWLEGLFASHPPSQERVEANRKTAATLPTANTRVGAEDYQTRLAHLEKTAPAYKAFDEGMAAAEKGQWDQVMSLAEKARKIEPREGLFYGLTGDAWGGRSKYRDAIAAYDDAIKRNDGFFYFYLQKGLAEKALGMDGAARADLQRSNALLPTEAAHFELGALALKQGDRRAAVGHYEAAAQGSGDAFSRSNVALAKLVMPDQPERYLDFQPIRRGDDRLAVRVTNRSPLTIKRLSLEVRNEGRSDTVSAGRLKGGESAVLATSIQLGEGKKALKRTDLGVRSIVLED